MRRLAVAAAFLALAGAPALAPSVRAQPARDSLRIGLAADPDALDPALGRTGAGRTVLAALCDTLVDYDVNLEFVPRLARSWEWRGDGRALVLHLRADAVFHDGAPVDAAAVKASLDRARTMRQSQRRSELAPIAETVVVDPGTLRLELREPFVPLLAQLAGRAGMIVDAKAPDEAGEEFDRRPVCAGPYRFVERVAQERIELRRFDRHWESGRYHFERAVYLPVPDATLRLARVQAGTLDVAERIAPADLPDARRDGRLKLAEAVELGWNALVVNVGYGPRAENALKDKRVREALALSIDRARLHGPASAAEFVPGTQAFAPGHPFHAPELRMTGPDIGRARALLRAAGTPEPSFTLLVPNDDARTDVARNLQRMAREAGFDIRLRIADPAAANALAQNGDFEAQLLSWPGRLDPDGNMHAFFHCQGAQNDSKFCDPRIDAALDAARETADLAVRRKLYAEASGAMLEGHAHIFLDHRKRFFAYSSALSGFTANPDGTMRLRDLRPQAP